jgi:hypothetical protein
MTDTLPPPKPDDMPIRQVDWPEAAQYAAFQSQLLDFDIALNALGRIRHYSKFSQLDPVIAHALYVTALNYYARIFKTGVRYSCSVNDLSFSAEEREEHDRLIALRDKWVSHSVNALDQVHVGILLSSFDNTASVVDVARMRLRHWSVPIEEVQKIEDFIRGVRQRFERKNQEAYDRVLERASNTPVLDLQRLPEISTLIPDTDYAVASRRR